jgi:hypothetical protein
MTGVDGSMECMTIKTLPRLVAVAGLAAATLAVPASANAASTATVPAVHAPSTILVPSTIHYPARHAHSMCGGMDVPMP